ncbi:MAG: hypothetical protein JRF50_17555 [Deltaproteobacteria bacterium]|nr:hypothetical protein [Deltaproteobacteria bacterium]
MGVTTWVPLRATFPIPWSIATFSALLVVQVRVLDSSRVIVDGSAEKVISGGWREAFFLTSMVIEAPGLPLKNTINRLVARSQISFSKFVLLPRKNLRREIKLLLKSTNPPRIFF